MTEGGESTGDPKLRSCLNQLFSDIQPDPMEREYLLTCLSTMVHGDYHEEIVTVFTGSTRNGKSLLNDLRGEYHSTIASNMLTRERPAPNQQHI